MDWMDWMYGSTNGWINRCVVVAVVAVVVMIAVVVAAVAVVAVVIAVVVAVAVAIDTLAAVAVTVGTCTVAHGSVQHNCSPMFRRPCRMPVDSCCCCSCCCCCCCCCCCSCCCCCCCCCCCRSFAKKALLQQPTISKADIVIDSDKQRRSTFLASSCSYDFAFQTKMQNCD